jgi:hypothetical protein
MDPLFKRRSSLLKWALAGVAASGCAGAESVDPAPVSAPLYVGNVSGIDALLAVVVDGEELVAYVCGGSSSFATHSRWFRAPAGDAREREIDLENDGLSLVGSLDGSGARGELREADGTIRSWTAAALHGGVAGLYAVEDEGCLTGVIVGASEEGADPPAQGTWCNAAGERAQVTPLRPILLQDRGFEVSVTVGGKSRQLFVTPVHAQEP